MNSDLLFFLLISLVLIRFFFSLPNKHKFWYNQPIMFSYSKYGKLGLCPNFFIKIGEFSWKIQKNPSKLIGFLNENFSESYKFPISIAENLIETNRVITLENQGKIIGSITWEPINILIDNKSETMYFVDNLCIDRKFRRKNLATLLISKLIKTIVDNGEPEASFIFKIDRKPLPFQEITNSNYYYRDLSTELGSNNFLIKKHNFKIGIQEQSYSKYIKNANSGYSVFDYEGIEVYGRIAEFKVFTKWKKVLDIDFLKFKDEKAIIDRKKWEEIENKLREYKIELITLPYIGYNRELIDKTNWTMANNVYWYFYNFSCPKISNRDFYVNFN